MDAPSKSQESEALCSLTTASTFGDPPMDLYTNLRDLQRLGLKRCGLFLTGLNAHERKVLYQAMLSVRLRHEIAFPFVHARGDMHPDEYRFLMGEFGAERFNLHRASQQRHEHKLPDELRSRIYLENAWHLTTADLEGFAGICLDFSHLEAVMYEDPDEYTALEALLERFPIGANHVSAFLLDKTHHNRRDRHYTTQPSDFDYLAGFPRRYFAKYVAIELTNPLEEQLAVKSRIEKLLARP